MLHQADNPFADVGLPVLGAFVLCKKETSFFDNESRRYITSFSASRNILEQIDENTENFYLLDFYSSEEEADIPVLDKLFYAACVLRGVRINKQVVMSMEIVGWSHNLQEILDFNENVLSNIARMALVESVNLRRANVEVSNTPKLPDHKRFEKDEKTEAGSTYYNSQADSEEAFEENDDIPFDYNAEERD